MLVFWSLASLLRNSVVLAVYLLLAVSCFFTVHEHLYKVHNLFQQNRRQFFQSKLPPYLLSVLSLQLCHFKALSEMV